MVRLSSTLILSDSSKKHFLSRWLVLGAGPERRVRCPCHWAVHDDKKERAQTEQAEEWRGIWQRRASG